MIKKPTVEQIEQTLALARAVQSRVHDIRPLVDSVLSKVDNFVNDVVEHIEKQLDEANGKIDVESNGGNNGASAPTAAPAGGTKEPSRQEKESFLKTLGITNVWSYSDGEVNLLYALYKGPSTPPKQ